MGCKKGCTVVGHEAYDNNDMLDGGVFSVDGRSLKPNDGFKNELSKLSIIVETEDDLDEHEEL